MAAPNILDQECHLNMVSILHATDSNDSPHLLAHTPRHVDFPSLATWSHRSRKACQRNALTDLPLQVHFEFVLQTSRQMIWRELNGDERSRMMAASAWLEAVACPVVPYFNF